MYCERMVEGNMPETLGWIRRNTSPAGRIARGVAGGAMLAGSLLVGPKWAKTLAAAAGGALATEAALGFCFVNAAVSKAHVDAPVDLI